MSPDLKSLMNRSAPDPSGRVDVDAVARRSRGLRRRDRLISLTTTLALGLAVFLFFSFAQPNDNPSGEENDRSQVVNPGPDGSSNEIPLADRAAVFAIKALTDSGLHDSGDIYFDYRGVDKAVSDKAIPTWNARFSGPECTPIKNTCTSIQGDQPTLVVELDGNEFVVAGTEGPLAEWRDRLIGIKGPSDPGPARFVWEIFYDEKKSTEEITHLLASSYWTGPIPGQYFTECEAQSGDWDEEKKSIPLYADSPRSEADRDDLIGYATEQQIGRGPFEVRCDPIINTEEEPYEMPPVPEDLELVNVGPEVIVPSEAERAPDKEARHSNDDLPTGPRYIVARGRFDEGEWASYQDKEWWYLGWGNDKTDCDEFEIGDLESDQFGWGCIVDSAGSDQNPEAFQGKTLDPGGGKILSLVYGRLGADVATVEFELTTGELVRTEAIEPPDELDVDVRYFVAFLPPAENGYIVARDVNGEELQRERLCQEECVRPGSDPDDGTTISN